LFIVCRLLFVVPPRESPLAGLVWTDKQPASPGCQLELFINRWLAGRNVFQLSTIQKYHAVSKANSAVTCPISDCHPSTV